MKIAMTVDLERDVITETLFGIKIGLPKILDIFERTNISATFFSTGEIIEKFPKLIKKISKKHEIAMHGVKEHIRLNKINDKILNEITEIKKNIENLIGKPVYGFRAPYLDIDFNLLKNLKHLGFKYDSSLSLYRLNQNKMRKYIDNEFEFTVQFPNIFFRFPFGYRIFRLLYKLNKENVMIFYLHPWEAINIRTLLEKLNYNQSFYNSIFRMDRWVNTGAVFLKRLEKFILNLKNTGFQIGSIENFI